MKSLSSLLTRRSVAAAPAALVSVALLCSACGGASANASPPGASSTPSTSVPFQGAIGQVAALTPPTMEVQNPQSGQVTVGWTTSTTFNQTVSVASSTVASGDCVVVSGTPASPGSNSSPVTARTISIVQPSATGSCTNPSGAGLGPVFRGGLPGGRASGGGGGGGFSRTSTPGNGSFPGGTFPQLATAVGKVTSTSSSGFVVHGVERSTGRFRPGSSSSSTTTTTQPPATDITVTTGSSTTATQDESASASALSVGACVTAVGPSNSTGAVEATSISIRPSTNGSCFGGFGGFRGGSGTTGGSGSANA